MSVWRNILQWQKQIRNEHPTSSDRLREEIRRQIDDTAVRPLKLEINQIDDEMVHLQKEGRRRKTTTALDDDTSSPPPQAIKQEDGECQDQYQRRHQRQRQFREDRHDDNEEDNDNDVQKKKSDNDDDDYSYSNVVSDVSTSDDVNDERHEYEQTI